MDQEIEPFKISKSTEDWIESTAAKRAELIAYGQSGRGVDGEKSLDSLTAIGKADAASRLLAEAESHLSYELECAMWWAQKNYPKATDRQRKVIEESAVREINLLVEACRVTFQSCKSRYYQYKG